MAGGDRVGAMTVYARFPEINRHTEFEDGSVRQDAAGALGKLKRMSHPSTRARISRSCWRQIRRSTVPEVQAVPGSKRTPFGESSRGGGKLGEEAYRT